LRVIRIWGYNYNSPQVCHRSKMSSEAFAVLGSAIISNVVHAQAPGVYDEQEMKALDYLIASAGEVGPSAGLAFCNHLQLLQ